MIDLTAISQVLNQLYANTIADQLNQRSVLLSRVRKELGEGKNIAFDVKVARGTSAGSYASGADIVGDDQDTEIPAVLPWCRLKAEFKVAGDALAAAASSGPAAYERLLTKQMRDATKNLGIKLNQQLYGDGTGNTGLDLTGLAAAVANTGTYAGISRTTYPVWQGNVLANGGVGRALTVDLLRTAETTAFTAAGMPPDFIVTSPAIYQEYAALFDSIKRVEATESLSYDAGVSQLSFNGIPVLRDPYATAGQIWFLNKDSLDFRQLPPVLIDDDIQLVQAQEPIMTADGEVGIQVAIELLGKSGDNIKGFVKVYGNLVCEHPNQNVLIKDIA